MALTIVFVHGYSVTNLNTFGELPLRLKAEGKSRGIDLTIDNVYLSRYISFEDVVVLDDVSRALQTAFKEKFTNSTSKLVVITHSTGGPVVRNWWNMYYDNYPEKCPVSHLVMLAPANYGSALAQLGKGKLSRINSWKNGVEPGLGILNWLEQGSTEAWTLNKKWILEGENQIGDSGVFPFVITGQSIDRKLYDNLNSYTGELGSDGVVRNALANLQARYIQLEQLPPVKGKDGEFLMGELKIKSFKEAIPTPFRVVSGKSHSGETMGIMGSVKKELTDNANAETVNAIFDCLSVKNKKDYNALITKFDTETAAVQKKDQVEIVDGFLKDRVFIHDRYSIVIFRIKDTDGRAVTDFDLILTAGKESDPNHLPEGFFMDRQVNSKNRNLITYYFNYDVMVGTKDPVMKDGKIYRQPLPGTDMLGFQLRMRPDSGFVKYIPCEIKATEMMLEKALNPNETTMIDITVQRVVDQEVFRLVDLGTSMPSYEDGDFSKTKPSGNTVK